MTIPRTLATVLLLLFALLTGQAAAETLTIGGVGGITPLAKQLAAEYARRTPGVEVRVIDPPLGSNGGLRALAAGKVDIVVSGRSPRGAETGQAVPWLRTPLVLATSGGRISKGLTRTQVADIFAGRTTAWDDRKPIRLVLRGEFESETVALRALSPAVDAAVAGALKRTDLPLAENDLEALDTLQKIPGSLGTSSLGLLRTSGARLTALSIDGVAPSAKTLENGSYPLVRQFLLVTGQNPRPAVAALAAWLKSPTALAIARRYDYLPQK